MDADCTVFVPGGPPGWGYGIGLVLCLGLNAVLAPANENEMLVFHAKQQPLNLLWLIVIKFLLSQCLRGPNAC